jgi:hypothetical protein
MILIVYKWELGKNHINKLLLQNLAALNAPNEKSELSYASPQRGETAVRYETKTEVQEGRKLKVACTETLQTGSKTGNGCGCKQSLASCQVFWVYK